MGFTQETASKAGKKSSRQGTPNKDTKPLREKVNQLLEDQWDTVLSDLEKLKPKERVDIYTRLMEYALPKLNRTEIKEVTSLDEFIKMTPDQRRNRIIELNRTLNKEQNG